MRRVVERPDWSIHNDRWRVEVLDWRLMLLLLVTILRRRRRRTITVRITAIVGHVDSLSVGDTKKVSTECCEDAVGIRLDCGMVGWVG